MHVLSALSVFFAFSFLWASLPEIKDMYVCMYFPADSIATRQDELHNIEQWSLYNNLKLNRLKSLEIIFVDNRRKHDIHLPAELADIKHVDSINILGVTVTHHE